ncbi:MAG: hypothetical protein LAO21_20270 [Acidobacteriia bacterium]|nr:hypothetical protein [Terriglobia bacterium]
MTFRFLRMVFILTLLMGTAVVNAAGGGAGAGDASASKANQDPTYQALRTVGLSGDAVAVTNFTLKREAGTFIFKSGSLYFLAPVASKVTGAVFVGEGNFQLSPLLKSERQSLSILTKDSEGVINEEFNQLVLRFTDGTYEELKKAGSVAPGSADSHARDVLGDNQSLLRRTLHYNLSGRILQDLLGDHQGGLFYAFIKGKKYSGKLLFAIDPHGVPGLGDLPPVEPEEVALLTYDDSKLGIWCSFHLASEYNTGKAVGNQKNGVIHIEHQELDTTIERNARIQGTATTKFIVQSAGVRVAPFDLFPTLRVESVTDSAGQALSFIQEGKDDDPQFSVILPKALGAGESYVIKTTYGGKEAVRDSGGGNYYPVARDNWYPNSRFGDYAEYEMTFHIPKGLTMVATGTPVSNENDGNQNVSRWRSEVPQAVAGFNFGKFRKQEAKDNQLGYTIESYANTEQPDIFRELQADIEQEEQRGNRSETTLGSLDTTGLIKKALAEGQISIALYTTYFGPIPYKRVALTQQTATNFGQSWPTLVYLPITAFLDTTIRHQLHIDDTKGFFKIVGPHEVAHQWWGHAVGFASYRDQWMSEGFAEFSSSLYVQVIQKKTQEFKKFWDDERNLMLERNNFGKRAIDVGPVTMGYRLSNSKSGFDIYQRLIYPKGAYILHMIRMMMWNNRTADEKFIEMMRDFIKTYANQTATTEDFKAMVEKHILPVMNVTGDGKMDWFFNEYVYGTSLPNYALDYSVNNSPDGKLMLHVKMTQSNVDDNFAMRIPIYLELADSRVIRLGGVLLQGNKSIEQDVPLEGLKEKPKRVMLNYFNDVLCTQ